MTRLFAALALLALTSGATATTPQIIPPGTCGYVGGVWTCLPCPDPLPGTPSTCVPQPREPEPVPVDHPLAIALGALVVGLVARDALRRR